VLLPTASSRPPRSLEDLLTAPLIARLDRLDLLSRKLLSGKLPGERRSKRRGRSVEFADFRQYVAGDDLRHVDWNILGRLDKLFIKIFREEEDLSLHIILDASASMDAAATADPNDPTSKLTYAARLGAGLAYLGLVNQNRVSFSAIGLPSRDLDAQPATNNPRPLLRQLAPLRGKANVRRLANFVLELLEDATRRPIAPSTQSPAELAAQTNQALRTLGQSSAGRGICVYISDLLVPTADTNTADGLQGLAYLIGSAPGTYDTWCLQTLSPAELDPRQLADQGLLGDLRLTDLETNRGLEVTISPASIAQYKANLQRHLEACKRACLTRGIAHALVRTDTPVDQLLLGTLRQGGLLR
jgi:uncharacterized protein (DUF58 family)